MKTRTWIVALVAVALLATMSVGGETPAEKPNVVAQAVGNGDVAQVRVGLGNEHTSWGLCIVHEPESVAVDQHTSLGVYGLICTDIQITEPGALPGMWAGLSVKPFADIDVLYDFEEKEVAIWPGVGVIVEPWNTVSFVARTIYPLGDSNVPTAVDLNDLNYFLGLQIRF